VSTANNERILRKLATAVADSEPVVLATIVETRRSVPRHAGTKMLIFSDGRTIGTIGGGELEARAVAESLETIRSGKPRLMEYDLVNPAHGDPGICGGELKLYLEPYMPAHTVYIIGCGHVGRTVVDLAHWLGYRTIAIDDREDLVTEVAMPNADVRFAGTVKQALAEHPVTQDSSVVAVTRSTELDAKIIPLLLDTSAGYIGVMGSKTRWHSTRDRILSEGMTSEDLDRLHVPIGIDINAETLEEIAVSIMSEVIKATRMEEV
jgi:xanthine dehydrogenase accessory factor